jgi:hypothetical protein
MYDKKIHIRHAFNGGQVKIDGDFVDGYDVETKTVYQFHGEFAGAVELKKV